MSKLVLYTALHRLHRENGTIVEKGEQLKLNPDSSGVPLLIAAGRIEPAELKPKNKATAADGQ